MLEIGNYHDYTFLDDIGRGSFASVFRARHNPTHRLCAVKAFSKQALTDPSEFEGFQNEVKIIKSIDHPLISTVFELFENESYYFLSMELVEGDSLLSYINKCQGLTENVARKIFCQLVIVIDFIHNSLSVMHRDLKGENILLDKNGNIRLIDFGLSKICTSDEPMLKTLCGSPAYAAPELLRGIPYGYEADIWSVGVILFAMVSGCLPFDNSNITLQMRAIVNEEPEYPPNISPILLDLLKRLLVKDPKQRITIEGLKKHPWVAQTKIKLPDNEDLKIVNLGALDQDVISEMKALNIETSCLADDLLNNRMTSASASYKILRRQIVTDKIKQAFATHRLHRFSNDSSKDIYASLPTLDMMPTKLAATKNHPNVMSQPQRSIKMTPPRLRTIAVADSPLLPANPQRRRARALSFMKRTSVVVPNLPKPSHLIN